MTNVIHIRDKTGDKNEVYIGRGSIWGNPFIIGKDGSRHTVIGLYEEYAINKFTPNEVEVLRGKTLVCYCKPQACHGDVLIELLGAIK
jgi:hypothetical protein